MKPKLPLFIFMVIFIVILISAKDQSVVVGYSFSNGTSFENTLDFSSVLLKVVTEKDATCKYSLSQGLSYDSMEGNFDLTYGKLHEKSFTDLSDGIYHYYVKCMNGSLEGPELKITFRINSLVSAKVALDQDEPLNSENIEVTLITSKPVSQAPTLEYSFDSIVFNDLPLIGSDTVWRSHLIIPRDTGEAVVSFRFRANDLEGRLGEQITSGRAYLIDTLKPSTITDIDAVGHEGEIEVFWHTDEEDIEEFKIYMSASQGVDYTDFYADTETGPFYDSGAKKGKTYYYRVSAVDKAGNEGVLSKEVYATSLLSDSQVSSTGLALELIGKVDNFLTEIDLTSEDVENIKNSYSLKTEKEKNLFLNLDLGKDLENAHLELNSLKRDVEKYKLQDLSESELKTRIDSARLRLNIIKKKIPESLIILDDISKTEKISETDIEESLLELDSYLTQKEKEKSLKETLRIIEESGIIIKSEFYSFEIVYLDGTRKGMSLVKRIIEGEPESENSYFVEIIPKDVAESTSEIDIQNSAYEVVKEDPVISFSPETKEIIYTFNKRVDLNSLGKTKLSFAAIIKEEVSEGSSITGFFLFESGKEGYFGIIIGVVIVLGLLIYFGYLKKRKFSSAFFKITKKIEEASESLKNREIKSVQESYDSLKKEYSRLGKREKKKIYKKIEWLNNKILVSYLNQRLEKDSFDKEDSLRLERIYNSLPKKFRKEVKDFEKIKSEVKK